MPKQSDVRELRVRVGTEALRELKILAAQEDVSLANLTRGLLTIGLALIKVAREVSPEQEAQLTARGLSVESAKTFTHALLRAVHAIDEAEAAYGAPIPDVGTPAGLQEKLEDYRRRNGTVAASTARAGRSRVNGSA